MKPDVNPKETPFHPDSRGRSDILLYWSEISNPYDDNAEKPENYHRMTFSLGKISFYIME